MTPQLSLIVGLGEALFDVFPDRQVLGGAPLNVAVHAHQLAQLVGGQGIVVSRIGDDSLGQQVLADLSQRGMTTDFVQLDSAKPTGRVNVTLQDGEPDYEIETDVAWGAMELTPKLQQLASTCSAVCFGTLAQHDAATRETIRAFLNSAKNAIRMFDVNLRQHYYSRDIIETSCNAANAVKLNAEELPVVSDLLDLAPAESSQQELTKRLRARFDLDFVALTRGPQGTVLITADDYVEDSPVRFPSTPHADSVGAGDACSAALLLGMSLGWPLHQTVELANLAGAYVASVPGATPQLPEECLKLVRDMPTGNN